MCTRRFAISCMIVWICNKKAPLGSEGSFSLSFQCLAEFRKCGGQRDVIVQLLKRNPGEFGRCGNAVGEKSTHFPFDMRKDVLARRKCVRLISFDAAGMQPLAHFLGGARTFKIGEFPQAAQQTVGFPTADSVPLSAPAAVKVALGVGSLLGTKALIVTL